MQQLHIDAITLSSIGDMQYVLNKGLYAVLISEQNKLLEYLKDGYEILGKYNNGTGYYDYKTTDKREICCIKNLIEKELLGFEVKSASTVTVSFQEFFEPVTCKSQEVRAFINFYNVIDGKLEHEKFRFYGDNAKRVRDIISILNMKQDKATVIHIIETSERLKENMSNEKI